ncbi:iron complex outermembrane receptor protein [Sphingomonas vulcanisoli]|uniref:Iron complex outermembrane receptor protein n=1 Tax=Sphingomonas vulcanisoli TaxID=1658060 RepID=A0ABX0TPY6_9SPHN|nr:TonB-dependent receptor [Sphingomonas vulcanisoli]NIJ07584.1 iron complex outermembrane receptor protein [Sphingomonas vulcanisoli]
MVRTLGILQFTAGTAIALALAAPAFAQSAAAKDQVSSSSATPAALQPGAAASDTNGQVAEIVVTAERRVQSLQTVPISATVLNAADIARNGINNVADLQRLAPSVAINTYNRSTFINIRGVGIAQSAPTSNPGVAYYIDGALIPHEQFIGQSFYDLQAIEVLRGPQGTLTGQNSTGGAVYVTTPKPDPTRVSGYVDQTIGNYNSFKTVAAVNVPLSDTIAVRVAGTRDFRDSFWKNIGPSPTTPGDYGLYAGRMSLAGHSVNDVLRVAAHFEYFNLKSGNNAVKRRGDTVSTDPFTIEEDARSFQNQHGYRLSEENKIKIFEGVDFRTFVNYQRGTTIDQTDGDRSATARPQPPASNTGRVSYANTRYDTFIGEINLLSTGKGPFNWVAGAFLLDEYIDLLQLRDNFHTTDLFASNSTIQTRAHNKTKSVFGQANWFATHQLELVAGLRYSNDIQVYNRIIPAGPPPANPALKIASQESNKLTGKIAINYHLDQTLFYVSASEGYKAGGVNLTIGTPNFGPEKNRVYEAGIKTTMLDHHLRVNGDIYYSDYRDIQLSSLSGGLPVTQNAASGHSYGAELEATGQFGPLGFNGGLSYLHARFGADTCITDTNQAGTDPGCPTNLRFVPKGRVLPFAPKWSINGGVQYEFRASDEISVTPRVQGTYVAQQVATPFPSTNTIVPGHTTFDARLTFNIARRYQIEGFVQNFTNKTYIASQIQDSSSATGGILYGAPRTFGVRGVAKF